MATKVAEDLDLPPSKLKILGKTISVIVDSTGEFKEFGEFDQWKNTITIEGSQPFEQKRDTLIHELSHYIEYQFNFTVDHKFIYALGTGLSSLLRDNPELVKWLTKEQQ